MNFVQKVLADPMTSMSLYIAVALGVAAFAGALITNVVNWLNARAHRKWEHEKWLLEHKETACRECLNHLTRSRTVPLEDREGLKIDREDFLGRMQSLQYVPVWATVLEAYSSDTSRMLIHQASATLSECVDKARKAANVREDYFIPDGGLTGAIDNMLKVIIECAREHSNSRCSLSR